MRKFKSADDILDFAIAEEIRAAEFYRDLARRTEQSWTQKLFEDFALQEEGHKLKLLDVKQGKQFLAVEQKITDLKISDYLVDVEPQGDMSYQDALVLAMKKEKAAFKLYSDLAALTEHEDLRQCLLGLAQEEANHKLRFEIEYDNLME